MVIVGGAGNSIDRDQGYSIESDLVKIVSATSHTNVELVPVFERYDRPQLSSSVKRVNLELDRLLRSGVGSGMSLIPVDAIGRWGFTSHGLHLNRIGKDILARLIANSLRGDTAPLGSSSFLG